jgi:hypothetical protein
MRVGDSWEANLTLTSGTPALRRTLSASARLAQRAEEQHALERWAARTRDRREAHDRVDRWLKR